MSELGKNVNNQFLPAAPSAGDILDRLGIGAGGWDAMNDTAAGDSFRESIASGAEDLKRCYVKIYADPAGRAVIDDLIDQSLRRSVKSSEGFLSMEAAALYMTERQGQNGMMAYILRMIHEGQKLPNKAAAKKAKKSNNSK